ncbi:META domain-containing protein [Corynebacterium sp. A21]|uniref:META domain-containing protein n=1 Tax=Corynebacterium sp. A21 TaxID=3457318 RepID=UPI003FD5AAE0
MKRIPLKMLGGLVLATALLGGCSSSYDSPGSSDSAEGSWGSNGSAQPQLTLEADGKLHGTDGCNRMMGSWEYSGEEIALGDIATTMMACEGVDTWLSAAGSLKVEGDTLHVFDADGEEIGTLPRMEASAE